MASAANTVYGMLCGLALAGCGADGTTASCRNAAGQELPLYNIDDVDPDSGLYPDAEVNEIRSDLEDKGCLTKLGHPPLIDAGSD
jgi:hypothetical protein